MDIEQFKSFTRISCSLWGDWEKSVSMGQESLAVITALGLEDENALDRASKVLIERAEKTPPSSLTLQHPFYRLSPLERFILASLHGENWGYVRIAGILGVDARLIEPWAWALRIRLCFQEIQDSGLEYPRGPTQLGPSCPEYNLSTPWTQRLLDEEMSQRDRVFLQNHLMGCARCRQSLELTRKMIFRIDSLLPKVASREDIESAAAELQRIWEEGIRILRPASTTFFRSVGSFLWRPATQTALVLLGFCLFLIFKK